MFKRLLTGSAVFTLLLVGSLPAFAQAQAPGTAPATPKPEAPQREASPQPGAPRAEVSQADLQKFANAVKKIQAIQQESEKKMIQAIESEGLSPQRFGELLQAQQTPEGQPNQQAGVSREEMQKFEQVSARLTAVQEEAQSRMQQAVRAEGLEENQFRAILATIQQDPALQQQVRSMIRN